MQFYINYKKCICKMMFFDVLLKNCINLRNEFYKMEFLGVNKMNLFYMKYKAVSKIENGLIKCYYFN